MTYVGATPTTGDFKILDSITTSSATTFNLRQGGVAVYPQSANHCLVVLNGVLQTAGSSFNIVNDTIVFASSLASSDVINQILVLGNVNDIGTPSDDTVSTAKLQANSVTAAKFNADVISGQTELATTPADTDELLLSDAGVIKRIDYSHLKSGGLVLVHSSNSSSSATSVSFDNIFTTTYDNYLISGTFERDDDAGTYVRLLKSSDGSERSSSYYMTDFSTNTDDTTPDYSNSNGASTFYIGRGSGSDVGLDTWFKWFIKNPMGSSITYLDGILYGYHDSRNNHSSHNLMGHNDTEEQHRGFKLVANSGNITAYNIKVWGLINS